MHVLKSLFQSPYPELNWDYHFNVLAVTHIKEVKHGIFVTYNLQSCDKKFVILALDSF